MNVLANEAKPIGFGVTVGQYRSFLPSIVAILVLIAYFSFVDPLFLSTANAGNIGRESAVLLMVALAETAVVLVVDRPFDRRSRHGGGPRLRSCCGLGWRVRRDCRRHRRRWTGRPRERRSHNIAARAVVPGHIGHAVDSTGIGNQLSQGQSILFEGQTLPNIVNGTTIFSVPNIIWFAILLTVLFTIAAFRTRLGAISTRLAAVSWWRRTQASGSRSTRSSHSSFAAVPAVLPELCSRVRSPPEPLPPATACCSTRSRRWSWAALPCQAGRRSPQDIPWRSRHCCADERDGRHSSRSLHAGHCQRHCDHFGRGSDDRQIQVRFHQVAASAWRSRRLGSAGCLGNRDRSVRPLCEQRDTGRVRTEAGSFHEFPTEKRSKGVANV